MPCEQNLAEITPESDALHAVQPQSPVTPLPDDEWIAAHYPRIHRAAWLMTGDSWEAEDLAQETFVVAIDRWDRFDGRSSRATWLYGILIRLRRRRARTFARWRRRIDEYIHRKEVPTTPDPKTEFAYQQWRSSVWSAVANLPDAQRDAVLLRFAEGMTYEQVAQAVGCAVGTAKTRIHHGLKRLRMTSEDEMLVPPETRPIQLHAASK